MEYPKILELLSKGDTRMPNIAYFIQFIFGWFITVWLQKLKTSKYFKDLIFDTL